jgi:hypothetical protein
MKFVDARSPGQHHACLSDSKEGGSGTPHGSVLTRHGQNAFRSRDECRSLHVNLSLKENYNV